MEFSHLYKIRMTEDEAKGIIAKSITDQGEYFVYPHDVSFVPLTNGKIEVIIREAHKTSQ